MAALGVIFGHCRITPASQGSDELRHRGPEHRRCLCAAGYRSCERAALNPRGDSPRRRCLVPYPHGARGGWRARRATARRLPPYGDRVPRAPWHVRRHGNGFLRGLCRVVLLCRPHGYAPAQVFRRRRPQGSDQGAVAGAGSLKAGAKDPPLPPGISSHCRPGIQGQGQRHRSLLPCRPSCCVGQWCHTAN